MVKEILKMLGQDHENVKQLMHSSVQEKTKEYFNKLNDELNVHMNWEEEYFYPIFENIDEMNILKGYYEHELIKKVLTDLNQDIEGLQTWIPKVSVLRSLVEIHVKNEEDSIFNLAEKNLNNDIENEIKEKLILSKKKKGLFQ